MRRANQLALVGIGPAVQRADDVGLGVAAPAQHDGLTVPADIGDQLDTLGRAHQGPAFALLRQRVVVADFRDGQCMADIAGPSLEDARLLALEQIGIEIGALGIEIGAHRELGLAAL